MLSYHNDPAIKAKYMERFAAHRAADQVIQGTGFDNGRGCFVGCTLDAYNHERFPVELGWPTWLAHLADWIFEGLPTAEAPQFGADLLAAVPVGVDLAPVRVTFLLAAQQRNLIRLKGNVEPYAEQCRAAIRGVIKWLEAGGNDKSAAAAAAAVAAAAAAAESAAESAVRSAWSAAWSTAWSEESAAAESAAESAMSAAWSAAESAAWSAAESAEYQTQRDNLLTAIRSLQS